MSTADATEQFSKSDMNAIAELRDPIKRSAGLKLAKRMLKFYVIGTVVLFAIAQILIFVASYGQLYKDTAAFFWAVPSAVSFLGLSMLGLFLSARLFADIKAIHVYEALAQDQSVGSEK